VNASASRIGSSKDGARKKAACACATFRDRRPDRIGPRRRPLLHHLCRKLQASIGQPPTLERQSDPENLARSRRSPSGSWNARASGPAVVRRMHRLAAVRGPKLSGQWREGREARAIIYFGTPCFQLSQFATTFLMKGAEAAQRLFTAGTKPPESPSGPHPHSECQAVSPG
jgi:hypothetical protein